MVSIQTVANESILVKDYNVLSVKNSLQWRSYVFTIFTSQKDQWWMNNMYKIARSVTATLSPSMSFPCTVEINRVWVHFPQGLTEC